MIDISSRNEDNIYYQKPNSKVNYLLFFFLASEYGFYKADIKNLIFLLLHKHMDRFDLTFLPKKRVFPRISRLFLESRNLVECRTEAVCF
jgi:hypothetical protein